MRFCSMFVLAITVALAACTSSPNSNDPAAPPGITHVPVVATPNPTPPTPTPVAVTIYERYTVRAGDTLSSISLRFDISLEELMRVNNLTNANALQINQQLKIPAVVSRVAPDTKLLPDSEVVYSPAYATFDVAAIANQYNGYLNAYREKVEGEWLTGAQIIQLVAERYSVGPRVLLALMEFQSGWVTQSILTANQIAYPMGNPDGYRQGLFLQASWAANRLNEGYYGKITKRLEAYRFKDRSRARIGSLVNPGTAAIQNVLAQVYDWNTWQTQISESGFIATYRKLFGDPNQYAIEPLIPTDLKQPALRLPWNDGEMWYYTGGPHGGWGDYPWAAVDFTPKDVLGSCFASRLWTVAAAPGKVVRAEHGRVVLSLSNDDFPGKGWTLMYLHIANVGRVSVGTLVNAGDRIGHPSCEGGVADSTHIHFARLYNGQWIDTQILPMVLSGWTVIPLDQEYNGKMLRGAETREACNCRDDVKNGIVADSPK